MPLSDFLQSGQMREPRSLNLAPIRLRTAVRNQINPKLSLRGFNRGVGGSRGHLIPLRKQLKVVDERLHRLFHFGPARRHELRIVRLNLPLRHLVQALLDDSQRLTHFLHTTQVTVVAVAFRTDRDVEIQVFVRVVRLLLA